MCQMIWGFLFYTAQSGDTSHSCRLFCELEDESPIDDLKYALIDAFFRHRWDEKSWSRKFGKIIVNEPGSAQLAAHLPIMLARFAQKVSTPPLRQQLPCMEFRGPDHHIILSFEDQIRDHRSMVGIYGSF